MAGVSFPVKRPVGRALIVASASSRAQPLAAMQALGFTCAELDDPYAAAQELLKRPLVYRALVLSLTSLFREELQVIATLKSRLPHVDIWLTHIEGRQAALAEAQRLGADGLLAEGGLHRTAVSSTTEVGKPAEEAGAEHPTASEPSLAHDIDQDPAVDEPVLSAEELRALLQEQPMLPPDGEV